MNYLKIFISWEAVQAKFDSGVIFLDQSQLFAMHSSQWDFFILYRQQITSNMAFFGFWVILKDFKI